MASNIFGLYLEANKKSGKWPKSIELNKFNVKIF